MRGFSYIDILYLIASIRWTLLLAIMAFSGSAVVGIVTALLRMAPFRPLRWIGIIYVQIVQGIPLLAWLFLLYFGMAALGVNINPWLAAALSFAIYGGAYLGEVWRGALESITKTQWEAGACLGLSYSEQLRHVIIPQSIRIAIPPTVGFLVQLIKNTSLASIIGLIELTRQGQLTTAATYSPFAVYLTVAVLYFALCFPLTQWSRSYERKLNAYR
ncbi:amino acid ABC transporter permease [Brenneria sp. hezel4-2-4]|nr:amino acid ABC transporter permease [Brenneria sp. hezel4-2-4]